MSGWKDWVVGEKITEADFQSFIQDQVVQVYADSTARSTALGVNVSEGMCSYLQDSNVFQVYTGSSWVTIGTPSYAGSSGDIAVSDGAGGLTTTAAIAQSRVTDLTTDLAGKQATITGAATTITSSDLTASRALASDGSGKVAVSAVTATELGYVSGVTSAIQTQLDGKVSTTNGQVTTAATGSNVVRNITLSTSAPSGGSDGDVWFVYTA